MPYHVDLSARLFEYPYNMVVKQEREMGETEMTFMIQPQESHTVTSATFHWTQRPTVIHFKMILHRDLFTRRQERLEAF